MLLGRKGVWKDVTDTDLLVWLYSDLDDLIDMEYEEEPKMPELKKCPFCGGEARFSDEPGIRMVRCKRCEAKTGRYRSFDAAAEAWNRRAQPENNLLTLEELREMNGEPVYILNPCDPRQGFWEISVDAADYIEGRNIDSYGKTWIAYRHRPEEE